MHYYSHNINDFNNATIHLSVEEECMYHRALAWYYSNETPLPNDKAKIYRYLRATTKKLQTAVDNILDDFFTQESDGFHQSRCDAEIQEYKDRQTKAIEAGKASAEARRKSSMKQSDVKQSNNDSLTDVQQVDEHKSNDRSTTVQPTNNHKPETNNHKPNNKNKYVSEASEVFEFWKSVFEKSDSTIFSDKRKSKVIKRLEDGYTVEQIKQAIYNCSKSEYHISNNHTDLELICRDVEKIDRFLGLTQQIQLVNNHANHQPTYNQSAANQPVASHVSYGQNLMAELERELATQQSQHAFDDSYHGDVYDMETPV